jgi:uncharacterized membrane protein YhaH (DUF805 family)
VILGDKAEGGFIGARAHPEDIMDWKYLFTSFEGRISRKPFWLSLLVLVVAQWILFIIFGMVLGTSMSGMDPAADPAAMSAAAMQAMIPLWIIIILFLYPSLAIYAKRWHDRGKSGWWTLICLVPFIGGIWLLVECGFLRGTEGPNQYGNDPLG